MNYEDLLKDAQEYHKKLKEKAAAQKKTLTKIGQNLEQGDLNDLAKSYTALRTSLEETQSLLSALEELTSGFDGRSYMANGEFAEQMLQLCKDQRIDVHGTFPSYEMFPYRVVINPEGSEVTINRKKVSCLRPVRLVRTIRDGMDKLSRDAFNAPLFAKELAAAYDLALLKQAFGGRIHVPDADVYLSDLYDYLTPMRRFRRDFDRQSYAYALARLYTSTHEQLDDGRYFQFGPSREGRKSIRILDKNGSPEHITTIRFYKKEDHRAGE